MALSLASRPTPDTNRTGEFEMICLLDSRLGPLARKLLTPSNMEIQKQSPLWYFQSGWRYLWILFVLLLTFLLPSFLPSIPTFSGCLSAGRSGLSAGGGKRYLIR